MGRGRGKDRGGVKASRSAHQKNEFTVTVLPPSIWLTRQAMVGGWLGHEKTNKSTPLVKWTVNGNESCYRYRPVIPNGIFRP